MYLPKRQVFLCLAASGAVLSLAACDMAPVVGELKAHPWLVVVFAIMAIMAVTRIFAKPNLRGRKDDGSGCGGGGAGCSTGSHGDGGSGCGSGCGGGGCGGD